MNKLKFISKVRKSKSEKGITLIALVVTVVVLLILAGVTISFVMSDGGMLKKAKNAQNIVNQAQEKDGVTLDNLDGQMDSLISGEAQPGEIATGGNKPYTDKKGKTLTVPEGFTVSKIPGEQNIDTGLVIYDIPESEIQKVDWTEDKDKNKFLDVQEKYNQYVWVPVETPSNYYTTENVTINQGGVNVTAKHYTKTIGNITRVKPNNNYEYSRYSREPGILTKNYCDSNLENRQTAFGKETTLQEMTQKLVDDYEKMIESLETYKGFYIGRYELTNEGEKKGKITGNQNWYTAYFKCKNLKGTHTNLETSMIFGLQWDATCKWLDTAGFTDANSRTWGNYKYGNELLRTGISEHWKTNNIYDLSGNCKEWTQEAAYGDSARAFRGERSVAHFNDNFGPGGHDQISSSRSTLYIIAK